ncbi:RagB/SusD family nutrient uptake outer membrane protein [Pedobacter chinensis]|uniref:RagB/SusD family nutrient uptake outer membrane protein n=1 Tax=Pedobacter chinensis TaxID=2282421 RepID=A0A369PVD3_9SPHI|nr:RagB/SusD family nutrient uptake outer membrane protein [Pedobacter chinensis]RDC54957.1 RagB/SusD family nutrient uptake outer membrane protein [Pedobacter chinensis]
MKLKKNKFIATCVVVAFMSQSCNKYLDKEPDNRTEINTVEKVAQLVATAYPQYDYLTFTEAASDNAEDKGSGVGTVADVSTRPYFWQDVVGSGTGTSTNYWNGCYAGIAAANQALESIDQNDFGSAVNPYKGEALVARAYAHFMLVTLFSKAYQIGGTNDSPGIPYVTEPETVVIKQYERETVQKTYEKIEKDLTEGIALLSASAYEVPKYHFTPAAAHAFASRFYLFKGEWQKVIDHVSAIVPSGDFLSYLRPINSTLKNMTLAEFNAAFTRSDQKSILLLANQYSGYQRLTSPRYGYGQTLVRMFEASRNYSGKALAHKIIYYSVPNYTTYKYKEYFYRVSPNASTGYPYIMSPLLSVDEALMNRAEAYAQLNQLDKAIKDVTDFMSVRINNYSASADAPTIAKAKTYYSIMDDKEAVIKLILESKKFEFLQEGIRWFDILRHRLTVKHNVYDTDGAETFIELGPDDNRRMFQIPEEASLSGVPLNPR